MKQVTVRFEPSEGRDDIEVVFSASAEDEQVLALMERVADPLAGTLTVHDAAGATVALSEARIVSISSDNKGVRLTAEDGTYWLKMALQDIAKELNPSWFLRISRYEIVNLRKIKRFDFSVSGTLRVELENDTETWASRRFIPVIKGRLQKMGR